MVWFKVDDRLYDHPKVMAIPKRQRLAAMGMWVLAGSWSAGHLSDGWIPGEQVCSVGAKSTAAELCDAGLWLPVGDGYQFHAWSEWQPTRAHVEAKRKAAADRLRRWRERQTGDP